jgi:hypothetical protein
VYHPGVERLDLDQYDRAGAASTRSSLVVVGRVIVAAGVIFLVLIGLDLLSGRSRSGDGSQKALAGMAGAYFVIGSVLIGHGRRRARRREQLRRDGTPVDAVVTGVSRPWFQGPARDGSEPAYVIGYTYRDLTGRAYRGKLSVPSSEALRVGVGNVATVRIDPLRPHDHVWMSEIRKSAPAAAMVPGDAMTARSRESASGIEPGLFALARRSPSLRRGAYGVVISIILSTLLVVQLFVRGVKRADASSVIIPLGALVIVWFASMSLMSMRAGWRDVRRGLGLVRRGVVTEGIVTAVREQFEAFGGRYRAVLVPHCIVEYRYRDDHDAAHRGTSGYLPRRDVTRWRIGDKGTVRFDPQAPEVSVWVG